MAHRIAVIGGDGIGPEVVAEALKVVRAGGVELDTTDFDLGGARYLRDGTVFFAGTPAELFASEDPLVQQFVQGLSGEGD